MQRRRLGLALAFLYGCQPAFSSELCGVAPLLADAELAARVNETVRDFQFWSGSGDSYARMAAEKFSELARDRPPAEARLIAAALLYAECIEDTRGEDAARLPWYVKDRLAGLSRLVPDFQAARDVLARVQAAEMSR